MKRRLPTSLAATTLAIAPIAFAEDLPPFKLGLSFQVVSAGFELIPQPPGQRADSLTYRPAQSNYAGVILGYRWLGGGVSFSVPAAPEIREIEGTSRYRDYRLSYYARRIGVEVGYSRYFGYLIENSDKLSAATLGGQRYYKIPDLETIGYGASLIFVFNPERYLLPAAQDQSDVQGSSGGSLLALAAWRQQDLESSQPLLPAEKRSGFGEDQDFRAARTGNYAAGAGYGHNWIFSRWFIAPTLAATVGYQRTRYTVAATESLHGSGAVNIHLRLALGFNSRSFFLTGRFAVDRFTQYSRSVEIGNSIMGLVLTTGARF